MKKIEYSSFIYLLFGISGTLIVGGILLSFFGPFSYFSFRKNQMQNLKNSSTQTVVPTPTPTENNDENLESTPSSNPAETPNVSNPSPSSIPVIPIPTPDSSINNQSPGMEEEGHAVVQYFEQGYQQIEAVNSEDPSFLEKAKATFTGIVDFIFYEKEIQGYTFQGLTNSVKLKVIALALKIDYGIDQYFPNYKEVIKDKYSSFKGKLAVKYLEVTKSLCETVGDVTCNQAKSDFEAMKNSFGFTWSLLKELATAGREKISDFYLNWRNS